MDLSDWSDARNEFVFFVWYFTMNDQVELPLRFDYYVSLQLLLTRTFHFLSILIWNRRIGNRSRGRAFLHRSKLANTTINSYIENKQLTNETKYACILCVYICIWNIRSLEQEHNCTDLFIIGSSQIYDGFVLLILY